MFCLSFYFKIPDHIILAEMVFFVAWLGYNKQTKYMKYE